MIRSFTLKTSADCHLSYVSSLSFASSFEIIFVDHQETLAGSEEHLPNLLLSRVGEPRFCWISHSLRQTSVEQLSLPSSQRLHLSRAIHFYGFILLLLR